MANGDQVYSITNAQVPLSEDQGARTRKYLISMAIRTVCFIGAVVASGWLRWVLIVGAVILPYIAVVVANAGRERTKDQPLVFIQPDSTRQLTTGKTVSTDEPRAGAEQA